MSFRGLQIAALLAAATVTRAQVASAQVMSAQVTELLSDHDAIGYHTRPVADPVAKLNEQLQSAAAERQFEGRTGYLRSALRALGVPEESQIAVFSKTSLQAPIVTPANPRTIFFSDSVMVGWVPGEPFVEVAAADPRQGVVFYVLDQQPTPAPRFRRENQCLTCHISAASLGVPGVFVRSVFPGPSGQTVRTLGFFDSDHRSPFAQRWGGWFVTGDFGALAHMGNTVYQDSNGAGLNTPIEPKLDNANYLRPYSDVVALMVFEHQARLTNLLVRFGWQIRAAEHDRRTFDIDAAAREIAGYMLFLDEAPLPNAVRGTSGYAEVFAAGGVRDSKGRSLRDLDLTHRLMRYPCSYLIDSPLFDALPEAGRSAIYARIWAVLSEQAPDRNARLSRADCTTLAEVLRETRRDLPGYFKRNPRQAA